MHRIVPVGLSDPFQSDYMTVLSQIQSTSSQNHNLMKDSSTSHTDQSKENNNILTTTSTRQEDVSWKPINNFDNGDDQQFTEFLNYQQIRRKEDRGIYAGNHEIQYVKQPCEAMRMNPLQGFHNNDSIERETVNNDVPNFEFNVFTQGGEYNDNSQPLFTQDQSDGNHNDNYNDIKSRDRIDEVSNMSSPPLDLSPDNETFVLLSQKYSSMKRKLNQVSYHIRF